MSKVQTANSDFMAPPSEQETNCRRDSISRVDAGFRAAGCIFSNLRLVTRSRSCPRVTGNSYLHWKKCKCYCCHSEEQSKWLPEDRAVGSPLSPFGHKPLWCCSERHRTSTLQASLAVDLVLAGSATSRCWPNAESRRPKACFTRYNSLSHDEPSRILQACRTLCRYGSDS